MQVSLAHEQHFVFREIHAEVATGVSASEEENLDVGRTEVNDATVRNRLGHEGRSTRVVEHLLGRGMREEDRALRKGGVPAGVVAVIGADDDVLDGLRRGLLDPVDHLLRLRDSPLAVSDENAVVRDDDQTHRRHLAARVAGSEGFI